MRIDFTFGRSSFGQHAYDVFEHPNHLQSDGGRAPPIHAGRPLFTPVPWDATNARLADKHHLNVVALRSARVLGQIDRKFIACIFAGGEGGERSSSLVLVDQHAADERVRVERFLRDVCEGFLRAAPTHPQTSTGRDLSSGEDEVETGVRKRTLAPPVPVLLTRAEAERVQSGDRAWPTHGEDAATVTHVQCEVAAVPEVVADRLLAGDELRGLVSGYLARLECEGTEGVLLAGQAGPRDVGWQKALRWCPQELVDLINSKACRGAIMFNDTLTVEQCRGLLFRLSETALPFQCAHGRPSLVPLVRIEDRHDSSAGKIPAIDWTAFAHRAAL
ncbi:uncharacterized protein BXZ73DRAFT_97297 [Epithele typhae]|uniref:uncharacterized protein n=1 Tax=Epithele typhae TaxID=378194 RepID=UPI0020089BC4|nr:uncharacterized protein BXZ73DRAFT_97297 [Epithele typhae]KAH9943246.1 hypothetical protein BXZ73DRAFT_97297 [Epithele typhae]